MGLGILGWVIIGGIAGWLASRITGTHSRQGCLLDIVVGIVGAFIGGAIFSVLGGVGVTGFNAWSLLVATVGAVILLWGVNALRR
jgi:uncharacterized membrane protein YeaQ/YmgE (transglycosylase-associated protein family)